MKPVKVLSSELVGKSLSIYAIDDYMVSSGYESILPVDIENINNTGLIWYPFEPFLNQINIWVKPDNKNYIVLDVEHFTDNC